MPISEKQLWEQQGKALQEWRMDRFISQGYFGLMAVKLLREHGLAGKAEAYRAIGERFESLREYLGLSPLEMSKVLGHACELIYISQDRMSRIELGKCPITALELFAFCTVFDLDMQMFNPFLQVDIKAFVPETLEAIRRPKRHITRPRSRFKLSSGRSRSSPDQLKLF